MPGHYGYDAGLVNAFCDGSGSVMAIPVDSSLRELTATECEQAGKRDWEQFKIPALEKLSRKYLSDEISVSEDIRTIRADYLIRNIEDAFTVWPDTPRATHLTFDDFREYILPYKTADPYLADNRKEKRRRFADSIRDLSDIVHCQFYKNPAHWAAKLLNDALRESPG